MDVLFIFLTALCVFDYCDSKKFNSVLKKKDARYRTHLEHAKFPQELVIPIIIHFDHSLATNIISQYRSHSRKKIKVISNDILHQVKNIFKHPTLGQNVTFDLVDTRMLKNNSDSRFRDATQYLGSYCKWQAAKKTAEDRLYFSVLLTGLDLYNVDKKRKRDLGSKGRGYMQGMCAKHKSCTLLEYNPEHIGHTLAHEVAHSLGVYHDGSPNNQCDGRGHVMSALYSPSDRPHTWTPCNKRDLKRFLASKKSWCLRGEHTNRSVEQDLELT